MQSKGAKMKQQMICKAFRDGDCDGDWADCKCPHSVPHAKMFVCGGSRKNWACKDNWLVTHCVPVPEHDGAKIAFKDSKPLQIPAATRAMYTFAKAMADDQSRNNATRILCADYGQVKNSKQKGE